MGIIYKTINNINDKIYIGKEKNPSNNYLGSGKILLQAIKKYGKSNFKKEIIEVCSIENINEREQYWIKFFNSTDRSIGYNITLGGSGGDTFSNLTKDEKVSRCEKQRIKLKGKISNRKGKTISEESKLKIKNNNSKYWLGKHHSEETKEKLRRSRLKQNMEYRYASYILYNELGDKIELINVTKFLKDNNLSKTQFYKLIRGDRKEYKGFHFNK